MPRPPVSVTIIALNEEKNIARAIRSVSWADEVIVVDSGSKDRTVELARELGARVVHNPWPGHGKQKNFAQAQAAYDWILNIDADEEVSPELAEEIQLRLADLGHGRCEGYFLPRKTWFLGRWILHGGWYPNYLVRLANKQVARWTEPSIHEELQVDGQVEKLRSPLLHYSFTGIRDQVLTNVDYAELGSQQLKAQGCKASVLKLVLKSWGKFMETYLLKRGFLDGLPGFIISVNAAHSMFLKYAYLLEEKLEKDRADTGNR